MFTYTESNPKPSSSYQSHCTKYVIQVSFSITLIAFDLLNCLQFLIKILTTPL